MQIPNWMRGSLAPDFRVGTPPDDWYLLRWYLLPRGNKFGLYLHKFLRSDDDRACHDHPYWNISIIIKGRYLEWVKVGEGQYECYERKAWRPVKRSATAAHRIELHPGETVWTLFITGPRVREWFFHCPKGLVHWKAFTDTRDSGAIGKGCDQ